jgi:transketolase
MEEGVSGEASSLAGHQKLGSLTVIYDDNKISIEDDTNIALSEDVGLRYEAYGWHVQTIDWRRPDGTYVEDVAALEAALKAAEAETERPSFIRLRTIIAWPAPTRRTPARRTAPPSAPTRSRRPRRCSASTRTRPSTSTRSCSRTPARCAPAAGRAREWTRRFEAWSAAEPERRQLLDRLRSRRCRPAGTTRCRRSTPTRRGSPPARRPATCWTRSCRCCRALGRLGRPAESNNTTPKGEPSFIPTEHQTKEFPGGPYGRVLHFGIREHAMGSIMNGITLHGLTRVYGGTFLVFSDYMRPAVRLAALMKLPVTYVWTHDSIGLGEDGPTHQPIEHLAALRAIPGLDVVRPADANETVVAWKTVLEHTDRPAGLCLTRQNVPTFDRSADSPDGTTGAASGTARGAYVLAEAAAKPTPDVIIIATGSEVWLASRPGSGWRTRALPLVWCPCRAGSGSSSRTSRTSRRCCRRA